MQIWAVRIRNAHRKKFEISDGILEILPPKNLIEKERYFLEVFEQTADSPEELVTRLGLDRVDSAPDDIAALFVSKRG